MPTKKSQTGQLGEDIATGYLVDKKYKIIKRNHRENWGELDIIAKAPDKTLVFVEVKTLLANPNIQPEENLTRAKLEKLKRTAAMYAAEFPELTDKNKGWRIDLIAISLKTLTNLQKDCEVRHYENL